MEGATIGVQTLNFNDIREALPETSIYGSFGLVKGKRCGFCYNIVYGNDVYCCPDCRQDDMDFCALNEYKKRKLVQLEQYHSLTPEQKKIHNRKITLRRNPKAKTKVVYHNTKGINL